MVQKAKTRGTTKAKTDGAGRKIDRIDREIIGLLQRDGRISNTDIGKRVGISEGTVRTRLNRLIENEIIQIVAVSNPIKLGFKIVGHLRIQVKTGKIDDVIAELSNIKALWFIVKTTGASTGIDAEFFTRSLEELDALIFGQVNRIEGVLKTETTLTLDFAKRRYDWGIAGEAE